MLAAARRRSVAPAASYHGGVRVVALTAGERRHVYLFREDRADDCLARLAAHAADPDHPLTAADAELIRERVTEG